MKGLVFLTDPDPWEPPAGIGERTARLAAAPVALKDLPRPGLLGPDWAVLGTRMCGICGSDAKQMFMDDAEESADNAMTAFITFPQVLGHEVVAEVAEAGPGFGLAEGARVVLNPWLSCAPRGIEPVCPACEAGDYSLCWHFHDGRLSAGIHTGNSSDVGGGFAEMLPAHRLMAVPVPDEITDEVAVLADPVSVSLHAVTRTPPPPGGRAVVYGAGALGATTTALLKALHPDVAVAVVAAHDGQAALAHQFGADLVVRPEPRATLVEQLADWSGATLRTPWQGLPVAHPGHVDVVYDTVGSPATIEVGVRLLASRGSLVVTGVAAPGRFEWTPLYFKEIRLVGSNAFGIETVGGRRQHAISHYFDLVLGGRLDVSAMLTHTFRLSQWREAFVTLGDQDRTGAVKVAFDHRPDTGST
jgi:threonine dehydrogenase-like Zn-dependent dehydrogenase